MSETIEKTYTFAELSDRAKENALHDYLSSAHWDCSLQDGYADHEYFSDKLKARGFYEVRNWDWSIGGYRSEDYVVCEARISKRDWLDWYIARIEATSMGPFKSEEQRPHLTPMVLALETMIRSGMLDGDYWYLEPVNHSSSRTQMCMHIYGHDSEEIADQGPLAGASYEALEEIVGCITPLHGEDWRQVMKLVHAAAEEVLDEALASVQADYEWQTSMECFAELNEINDWRYDEDGSFVE